MSTVFSHIIQKRFSQFNEDVATDALAYVLESSDAAHQGFMKLLRGIAPDLPPLIFKAQQTEGETRPDMWGYADSEPRVFVENKFWAGLTGNQPVSYLENLAARPQSSVLLVIAPAAREHALWRELNRRLLDAGVSVREHEAASWVPCCVTTELGPIMALTSWTSVLSALEHEAADNPTTRGDLAQLRALCDAADIDAFVPVSGAELSNQRAPAFILQLSSVVSAVVGRAVTEKTLSTNRLRPQASSERIGRYVRIPGHGHGAGAWIGVHFDLWKTHGATPLWLIFPNSDWGRAPEVRRLLEPWSQRSGVLAVDYRGDFAIALDMPVGEERAGVVRSLVENLKAVAVELDALPPKTAKDPTDD